MDVNEIEEAATTLGAFDGIHYYPLRMSMTVYLGQSRESA